mgnify:CR=1 FL=1
MKNEGDSAQDAVPKKNAFTDANEKAAESARNIKEAAKEAADGINTEMEAAEQATASLNKLATTFDKDGNPLYKTETSSLSP